MGKNGNGKKLPSTAAKGIKLDEIIVLRKKGLSFPEIGRILGCSGESIRQRFRAIEKKVDTGGDLGDYKNRRSDILALHQKAILDAISPDDLKKASLRDKVISFGVLYDKETGQKGKVPEGIKIQIINYAGASNGGGGNAVQVTVDGEVVDADTVQLQPEGISDTVL